jgi:hypothetical protein
MTQDKTTRCRICEHLLIGEYGEKCKCPETIKKVVAIIFGTQDKTLREEFLEKYGPDTDQMVSAHQSFMPQKVADFYEDKIKSVVREMKKDESKIPLGMAGYYEKLSRVKDYNQFGDDLLERLGIK